MIFFKPFSPESKYFSSQKAQETKSLNVAKSIVIINIVYILLRMPIQIFADYVTYKPDLPFNYIKLYYSLASLAVTYNASSFFIYCATLKTFRAQIVYYLTCGRNKSKMLRQSTMSHHQQHQQSSNAGPGQRQETKTNGAKYEVDAVST